LNITYPVRLAAAFCLGKERLRKTTSYNARSGAILGQARVLYSYFDLWWIKKGERELQIEKVY
jgi:hypothetical protein